MDLARDFSTNEWLRLANGMTLKGWTVDEVDREPVLLRRDHGQVQALKPERQ